LTLDHRLKIYKEHMDLITVSRPYYKVGSIAKMQVIREKDSLKPWVHIKRKLKLELLLL